MKVAVVGLGLIGGSFEKASLRAGHEVATLHHGDRTGFEDADLILVCLPPDAVVPWIQANAPRFRKGTIVVDIAGVKRSILAEFKDAFPTPPADWTFVGGHPMAGREVSGYANSLATLFDGASMILVPEDEASAQPVDEASAQPVDEASVQPVDEAFVQPVDEASRLVRIGKSSSASEEAGRLLYDYFRSVGFARVVVTTAEHHDEMIAFTSQLCHVIATAYSRDGLVPETPGYSAGSYADMTRIATQDPAVWSELFRANKDSLLAVVDRFIGRMTEFRNALAASDKAVIAKIIAEGADAKRRELEMICP